MLTPHHLLHDQSSKCAAFSSLCPIASHPGHHRFEHVIGYSRCRRACCLTLMLLTCEIRSPVPPNFRFRLDNCHHNNNILILPTHRPTVIMLLHPHSSSIPLLHLSSSWLSLSATAIEVVRPKFSSFEVSSAAICPVFHILGTSLDIRASR
jgi:hypothetical protein